MIFAGILSGGSGTRMENAKVPKQFLNIAGVPLFIRTLRIFLSEPQIDKVIIAINKDWEETYNQLMIQHHVDTERVELTPGGSFRFESLLHVVELANCISKDRNSIIVTHDGARPFCTRRIIEENITMLKRCRITTTSIPVIDTILASDDGHFSSMVPDRSKLWYDQGPQSFYVTEFLEYANSISDIDRGKYMEAGKLYLDNGCSVGIVKGERQNFKITNDIDLKYAEFLIESGEVKE